MKNKISYFILHPKSIPYSLFPTTPVARHLLQRGEPPQRSGSSSRETLSAVAHGGNPQDRTADAPASLTLR